MNNIISQLKEIKNKYNMTGFKQKDGYLFLGTILLNHKYEEVTCKGDFYVSMFVSNEFPNEIPLIKDINSVIDDQFHKNKNNILCLACDADIHLYRKRNENLSICDFIENFVIPFFYSYEYYKTYNKLPFGERRHNSDGIVDFYKENFGVDSDEIAIRMLQYVSSNRFKGHHQCICNSGKIIRKCHKNEMLFLLNNLGIDFLRNDYNKIIEEKFMQKKIIERESKKQNLARLKKYKQQKRWNYYFSIKKGKNNFMLDEFLSENRFYNQYK